MIEIIEGSIIDRLKAVIELRKVAYTNSRRDQTFAEAWIGDSYDCRSRHLLMTDDAGNSIASVRMIVDGHWPIEDRWSEILNKDDGVEFGRLCVARHIQAGKRTIYELMVFASRLCIELGRPHMYGMTIAPLHTTLVKSGVPLKVLSEPIYAYGEKQNIVVFDANELVDFYQRRQQS